MNNHQRAVYQPLMENVPIYDLADEEAEEERSRLPLIIVIALLVLAAFAGVVWLAYNQGVASGRAGAQVVIAAPEGPVRTAPAGAGDSATPYTNLKVYGQPLPADQEAQSSSLAQNAAPGAALEIARQAEPAPATTEAPPVRLDPQTTAPQAPAAAPAKPAPAPAVSAPAAAARPSAVAKQAPAPAITPVPAAISAPAAPANAAAGTVLLQIGAYESEAIANNAYAAFHARYADVAGSLSQNIQKVDLGTKGIWYRLRVGPFAGRPAAITACEKLKAAGGTCFITAP